MGTTVQFEISSSIFKAKKHFKANVTFVKMI